MVAPRAKTNSSLQFSSFIYLTVIFSFIMLRIYSIYSKKTSHTLIKSGKYLILLKLFHIYINVLYGISCDCCMVYDTKNFTNMELSIISKYGKVFFIILTKRISLNKEFVNLKHNDIITSINVIHSTRLHNL